VKDIGICGAEMERVCNVACLLKKEVSFVFERLGEMRIKKTWYITIKLIH